MQFLKLSIFLLIIATAISAQTPAPTPAPPEQVTYLLGEVKITGPAGQPYGSSVSLVKRTMTPAENKIVEVVLSIDAKGAPLEFNTVFTLKDNKFTVKDDEKSFEGEGEFTGKPWNWTGWKYQVNMIGARKGVVKAEDVLAESGLTVKKTFYTPDGVLRVTFTEDLKFISKEMYDLLHSHLFVKEPVKTVP
jgi:hypothetical protein